MQEHQPWNENWQQQIVYVLIAHNADAPVKMPFGFTYPLFLGSAKQQVKGEQLWDNIADAMVYVLGHQPDHSQAKGYIYWLNAYNSSIPQETLAKGIEKATQGYLENAIWLFQAAVLLNPQMVEGHFNLGLAYYRLGMIREQKGNVREGAYYLQQTIQYLENTVELDPNMRLARSLLKDAQERSNSPTEEKSI